MTAARLDPAAPLRGTAVGLLTTALAIAAHGAAGGALPAGAVTAQLAVLAVTLGAVAATTAGANRAVVLCGLLGTGQVLAHGLLAAGGHTHGADPLRPSAAMLAAHLAAVTIGALLIAGGARLCTAVSRTVRAVATTRSPLPVATSQVRVRSADQPLHSFLLLAASVSHRGPPVGVIA
ncbi:hypothetical protein M1247_02650 [Mycobacterium sp. 21AC1]|uniref:hypothetical protein n=1 Tax=[Mycobacterium] appelbergii TaxID=2939269 RepID=UPI002938F461|nr:hypothetical protein [Mycobacterium sp. 21AC1]MDV3123806.1 hypothetical protein [Mycobacterium sp. 21AC1]